MSEVSLEPIATPQEPAEGRSRGVGSPWWLPALLSVGMVALFGSDLVFSAAIPARTDLPGHLLPAVRLGQDLLVEGRLRGWSFDWFAGFPLYYFYFPLPGLLIVGLSKVLGPGLALKVAALGPPLAMPWVLSALTRWARLPRAVAVGVVLVGSSFVLMTSFSVLGGNLLSSLTGEFAYGWGLVLAVLYLGLIARSQFSETSGCVAGLVLAAAILCHVLPALAAGLASALFLPIRERRRATLTSWIVAGLVSAFWTVPLVARLNDVGDAGWTYVPGLAEIAPLEIVLLAPAVLLALPYFRARFPLAPLMAAGLIGLALAALPQELVMRGRLLPVWFLAVHVVAGLGLGHGYVRRQATRGTLARAAWIVAAGLWIALVGLRGVGTVRELSRGVLAGLDERPGAEEMEALVATLSELPPGRIHWEDGDALDRWGGPHALALLPLRTPHSTLSGLWAESSPISSYVRELDPILSASPRVDPHRSPQADAAYDPLSALTRLRDLGVRYLLAFSGQTKTALRGEPTAAEVASFGTLALFDLGPSPLISVLGCESDVVAREDFVQSARDRFRTATPHPRRLVAAMRTPQAIPTDPGIDCHERAGGENIEDLTVEGQRVQFRTSSPGSPHLVRISHFPNWRVTGAGGPYLAEPWFMIVVPDTETVSLEFASTPAETMGWLLTALGLALLAGIEWKRSRPSNDFQHLT